METYDPNASSTLVQDIPEEKSVPTGLIRPEKKVDQSQMADFSTPIEEVMPGPNMMIQDEMMGPPVSGNKKTNRSSSKGGDSNPLGLTMEQYHAVLAGAASALAFSKPVQDRLGSMIPSMLGNAGELTATGMIVSAAVAAVLFFLAQRFLQDR
jgi:hypothetical protein